MDAHISQARIYRRFECEVAAGYLALKGMQILAKDWKCDCGSADVVALDGDILVFASARIYGTMTDFPEWASSSEALARRESVAARYVAEHHDIANLKVRHDRVEAIAQNPSEGLFRHHVDAFSLL